MEDWVVVFSGNARAASVLADRLTDERVPVLVGGGEGPLTSKAGRRSSVTRVSVPRDFEASAADVLSVWQHDHTRHSGNSSRRLWAVALLGALAPAAWFLFAWLQIPGILEPEPLYVMTLWLASLVVISQIEYRRRFGERIHGRS